MGRLLRQWQVLWTHGCYRATPCQTLESIVEAWSPAHPALFRGTTPARGPTVPAQVSPSQVDQMALQCRT